jgi:hypothetical protein
MRQRKIFLMIDPPVQKSIIRNDVEALFGRRSLSKSVRHVCAKNEETLCRSHRVEHVGLHQK